MAITRAQREREATPPESGGGDRSSAEPSTSKKGSAVSGPGHKTTPTAAAGRRRKTARGPFGIMRKPPIGHHVPATPTQGSARSSENKATPSTAAGARRKLSRVPSGSVREASIDRHVPATPAQRSARLSNVTAPSVSVSPILKRRTGSKGRSSVASVGERPGSIVESPGKRVSISGTTFMATDSDQEAHELDLGSVLDELPGLVTSSDETLGELARSGISRQQVQRFLRHRFFASKIASMISKLEAQKQAFGTAHYIPVERAVELFPTAGGTEWAPAPLYHRANLARLTLDVLALPRGTIEGSSFEQIDTHFPSYFLDSFQSEEERQDTFRLGLEIRTQWCLALFRKASQSDEGEDPDEILQNVYSSPSLDPKPEDLRGWDMEGLKEGDGALAQEFQEAVQERMQHIRQTFDVENMDEDDDNGNDNEGGVDIDSLNEMFPWSEFVVHLLTWVRGRANEIDLQLQSQESLEQIIPIIRRELDRRSSFGQDDTAELQQETEESPAKASGQGRNDVTGGPEETQLQSLDSKTGASSRTARTFNTKSLIEHMESKLLQVTRTPPKPQQASGISVVLPRPEQPQPRLEPQRPLDGSSGAETSHAQGTEKKNYEQAPRAEHRKHIIDRQDGAVRVSPISSVRASAGPSNTGKGPRKRTADTLGADDNSVTRESSLFQRDDRAVDVEGNRARVAAMTATAKKRQRVAEDGRRRDKGDSEYGDSGATSSNRPTEQAVTTTVEASDVRRGQPRTGRPLPSSMRLEQPPEQQDGARTADQRRRMRTGEADGDYQGEISDDDDDTESLPESVRTPPPRLITHPRAQYKPVARRRWLPQETGRLIYLVGKYGTSWTLIAQMDLQEPGEPQLARRNDSTQERYQVKLKDRAEQIVFNYYRAGLSLPRNFQNVPLRARMIKQLEEECGMEVPTTHRQQQRGEWRTLLQERS